MKKAGIILAGGLSRRLGVDKCVIKLVGKPLIFYVYERIVGIVDDIIIVVNSVKRRRVYSQVFPDGVTVVVDKGKHQSPLIGALTGFMNCSAEYSVLLPCDTPFISRNVVDGLFRMSMGFDAVIPRWPNGYIEPLQAVYKTKSALNATKTALKRGEVRLKSMISLLRKVHYVPIETIKEMNPNLLTFFNVNTRKDLKKRKLC